jgi:hypothetical protein
MEESRCKCEGYRVYVVMLIGLHNVNDNENNNSSFNKNNIKL